MITTGFFQNLTSLRVGNCIKISTAHLVAIPTRLVKLRVLEVFNMKNVTDDFLVGIATHCADLRHLNISYCEIVTDGGISALSNGKCRLNSLNLKGCPISDAALNSLCSMITLRHISIEKTWCSEDGITTFKQRLPYCFVDRGIQPATVDSFVWQNAIVEDVEMID